MSAELITAIVFSVLSLVPSGFVVNGLYSVPIVDHLGVTLPNLLYWVVPPLWPFTAFFDALPDAFHGDGVLAILIGLLICANAAMYGAAGYGLAYLFKKWFGRDPDSAGSMA
jgi:hypothetical protein